MGKTTKIQKSSTTGNESIACVGTAEEIKEKHCEAKGFPPILVGLARYELRSCRGNISCMPYPVIDGNASYPGVRIAEGNKETDCKMENNAPMLDLLTGNAAKIPLDSNPCQPSSGESQTFITDQKGEENVSPRITIEENTTNHLSKQRTELPKLSRMEIPTESCEKA